MHAFCSTPFFEPFAIPLLLEKLSSTLQSEKLDSLNYLNNCILHYGVERMFKHAKSIWSTLKAVIFAHSSFSSTSESVGNIDSQENEIALAALNCLQTAILLLNCPDSGVFFNLILDDDDVENYFVSLSAEKSHADISKESQCQLRALGNILFCSSKISHGCCSKVLQKFFPRLMNILEVSGCSSSDGFATNNKIYSKTLSFGALYLCVGLLDSCRHLTVAARDISPQVQDTWFNLLQDFAGPLTCALGSTLARRASAVASEETYGPEHVLYGVKGFRALAMFPEACSPVSDDVYEDILEILMLVIISRSDETFLWKLSLKAVVEIGSFIEKFHDSRKGIIYNKVVVERIVSLLLLDDSTVPLALKLEATLEIGVTGLEFMLRAVRGLEEAIFSNLSQAYVDENSKSAEVLVPLLECYSSKVLPWCHNSREFEEVAMHFAVNIWKQMESVCAFAVDFHRQGLLKTTMIAMKFAVADCTEENQALILQKAFSILSSTTCLSLELALFSSSKLEWLQLLPSLSGLSHKDECLLSLFASAVIALRPQTPLPDARIVFKLFMIFLLKGHVPAAQALASMINKWPASISEEEVAGAYTLEEAIDVNLEILFTILGGSPLDRQNFLDSTERFLSLLYPSSIQTHAVVGLAWIGKGLLMRGHERVKEIARFLLKCLVSSQSSKITPLHGDESGNAKLQDMNAPVARTAADAFLILLSDSDFCLNKKFHATIRPLYKQRFFSIMMPVLLSSIKESSLSCTRAVLYRAFGHVICGTPLPALVAEAKKVIPPLLGGLSALSPDIFNKDMIYNLLLILSGILMDENGKEAIMENVHTIISDLIKLISYPHMLLVRETAIQCLVAISGLPHTRIYPMRPQVLRALSKSLDDPKRAVRQEAVRCRQAWASIASRSLHF